MKSIMSGSRKTTVSMPSRDLSCRERLKLAGFSWDRSSKTWYVTKDLENYDAVRKAVYASERLLETPGVYVSSPVSRFLLSRWNSGGAVIIGSGLGLEEACESALVQGCCHRVVMISNREWKGFETVSFRKLKDELEDLVSPGLFVIFDGIPSRKSKAFDLCAILSLAAVFRVAILNPDEIKNIEDVQNAVLLTDPGISPSYDFFRDHIMVKNTGEKYSSKTYKAIDEFISKVSPAVRRDFAVKYPVAVPVKAGTLEQVLFERAKLEFTGSKSARLAELALVNAQAAGAEFGEDIPEDYITAKVQKALPLAEKHGLKVCSKFDKGSVPREKALSLTVTPKCDMFLFAKGLEDKKAKETFDALELVSKFADLSITI
jgi:hypothetical protein